MPSAAAASVASSLRLYRLSGTPRSAGRSHASATTRARVVGGSTLGRPQRGRSWSPSQPAAAKRARQRCTVVRLIRSCCASRREPSPVALPRMTRARRAKRCGVVAARAQVVSRCR